MEGRREKLYNEEKGRENYLKKERNWNAAKQNEGKEQKTSKWRRNIGK